MKSNNNLKRHYVKDNYVKGNDGGKVTMLNAVIREEMLGKVNVWRYTQPRCERQ
jgi:hypothetical protein